MKIVYTCSYAHPSVSGVWGRVENIARELIKKGHEIHILTSNVIAGTNKRAGDYENYKGIHIHRFPVKVSLTKYQLMFAGRAFVKKLEEIKPDVIDCQTYRHPEAKVALDYALRNKIPCVLTTHAPFLPVEVRGRITSLLANIYDILIGKRTLKKYDRIFRISDWELAYLLKLGADKRKIILSPNGAPEKFFKTRTKKIRNKTILFLGRIEPRKQVHILIEAFAEIAKKYPKAKLRIVGPIENIRGYEETLRNLIKNKNLQNSVSLEAPIYDLDKKIELINNSQLFVLPSTWEGFPLSLVEAMSLGKCIVGSDCDGNKEVIKDGKTGFLFKIGNTKQLTNKIDYCFSHDTTRIEKNARKLAENFRWKKIALNVEKVYCEVIKERKLSKGEVIENA